MRRYRFRRYMPDRPPRFINETQLSAVEIVEKSMKIAASICIYTNENFTIKTRIINKNDLDTRNQWIYRSPKPQQIVEELDKHIIGQRSAKVALAIALRNRAECNCRKRCKPKFNLKTY